MTAARTKTKARTNAAHAGASIAARAGLTDVVGAAWTEFFRKHPAEAKRQKREAQKDKRWNKRHPPVSGEKLDWLAEECGGAPAKPRAKARHGQRTTLQRASAWVNGEAGLARFGFTAEDLTLALGVVVVDPAEPARSDLDRLEHARFTVAVLDATHRFYQATRDAFPSRAALETALFEWTPAVFQWQVRNRQAVKAASQKGVNGRAFCEEVVRLSGPRPRAPARLRPVLALANILPRGVLKILGRERGKGAGGWAGNMRVEVLVGGACVGVKFANVDQTRRVVVDLLDAKRLDVLYGSGRRAGAKEAAKAVTAEIVGRSRAGVENLSSAARADGH